MFRHPHFQVPVLSGVETPGVDFRLDVLRRQLSPGTAGQPEFDIEQFRSVLCHPFNGQVLQVLLQCLQELFELTFIGQGLRILPEEAGIVIVAGHHRDRIHLHDCRTFPIHHRIPGGFIGPGLHHILVFCAFGKPSRRQLIVPADDPAVFHFVDEVHCVSALRPVDLLQVCFCRNDASVEGCDRFVQFLVLDPQIIRLSPPGDLVQIIVHQIRPDPGNFFRLRHTLFKS